MQIETTVEMSHLKYGDLSESAYKEVYDSGWKKKMCVRVCFI